MLRNFLRVFPMPAASPLLNRVLTTAISVVVGSLCGLMADDAVDIKNASRGAEQFINDYLSTPHGGYKEVIAWLNPRPDVFPFAGVKFVL